MQTLDLGNSQLNTNLPENPSPSQSVQPPMIRKRRFPKKALYILGGILGAVIVFTLIWFFLLNKRDLSVLKPYTGEGSFFGLDRVTNPLTGELVDATTAVWKDTRPLAIMINNHIDARPQSGLIYADLVYEIVAEGGITRYLAFFLSNTPEKIGPVRSTRTYYLIPVKELGDALIMHIGWSPDGEFAIDNWPVRSLFRGGAEFWRDNPNDVATEHTAYVDGKYLRERAEELGWGGSREIDLWEFKDDKEGTDALESASVVNIDFWYEGDYSAEFVYDASSNTYKRFVGFDENGIPVPHLDRETGQQISVKNVIVQFATETAIEGDDKGRLDYALIGSGEAYIFLDGKINKATWAKEERDSRTLFYDQNGNQIRFNRGKMWISVVADRNVDQVIYSALEE